MGAVLYRSGQSVCDTVQKLSVLSSTVKCCRALCRQAENGSGASSRNSRIASAQIPSAFEHRTRRENIIALAQCK